MNNLKQIATGTLAELNERYGLINRAPLDTLIDMVKASHNCSGKIITREKNGVYTLYERTAADETILRAYSALFDIPADEPQQLTLERAKRLYCGQYDNPLEWVRDEVTREGCLLQQSVRSYVIDWHTVLDAMSYRYAVYNDHYFRTTGNHATTPQPQIKDYVAKGKLEGLNHFYKQPANGSIESLLEVMKERMPHLKETGLTATKEGDIYIIRQGNFREKMSIDTQKLCIKPELIETLDFALWFVRQGIEKGYLEDDPATADKLKKRLAQLQTLNNDQKKWLEKAGHKFEADTYEALNPDNNFTDVN